MTDYYKTDKEALKEAQEKASRYDSLVEKLNKKIVSKIRKRIMTRQMLECRAIEEIQITKEEAEQLGEVRVMDNVKLIVVDKLGDMTNKDCFGYIEDKEGNKKCYGLNKLYCRNGDCEFYRTDLKRSDIEKDIRRYAYAK